MPAFTPHTLLGKGILGLVSLIPTGAKAGWDWHKRSWNTRTKEANPGAVFVDPSGNILNYEDNEHSLFNSFLHDRGVKEVREMPNKEEIDNQTGNRDNNEVIESDPLLQKKTFGGSGGNPQDDPTFKMWFVKNSQREDVMQAGSNLGQLKSIFLKRY